MTNIATGETPQAITRFHFFLLFQLVIFGHLEAGDEGCTTDEVDVGVLVTSAVVLGAFQAEEHLNIHLKLFCICIFVPLKLR